MIDPHNRPLLGDGDLILRAPIATDVDARFALGSHREILRMFGVKTPTVAPYSLAMAEDWIESQLQEPLAFVIEYKGQLIGALRLHSVNMQDRRASLAIAILEPNLLGQGLGTHAMQLILDHAFGAMALNRVTLRVIDYNNRAIAAYKKLGFITEGVERQAARVGDVYYDDIIMGLLASEWPQ